MYLRGESLSDLRLGLPILVIISRCILLLEDLDAAFTRSVTRDSTSTGTPTVPTKEAAAAETTVGSTLM
jgi:chaperone BCS1